MKYSRKAIDIVNDTWEYLENNYKGSEITMSLLICTIERKCDTENCRKQALKYLWENYEFFYEEDYRYYKKYFYKCLGIRVN